MRRANVAANAFGAQEGALPSLRAAGFASSVDTVSAQLIFFVECTVASIET